MNCKSWICLNDLLSVKDYSRTIIFDLFIYFTQLFISYGRKEDVFKGLTPLFSIVS